MTMKNDDVYGGLDLTEEGWEGEVEDLFAQWKANNDSLVARRRVEQYLEMKRLREQIEDVFDFDEEE